MSIAKRKAKSTAVIKSYKSRHFPFLPDKDYRHHLEGLMSELQALSRHPETFEPSPTYFRFYCYLYLNPLKPGKFRYVCPSGKVIALHHEPFYVGKGEGNRVYWHMAEAENQKKKSYKSHKCSTIRKILDTGNEPIIKVTGARISDYMACAFEIDLIAGIGRRNQNLGPLTNLTDGGDGISGAIRSEATKRKQSQSMLGKNKGIKRSPEFAARNTRLFKGVPKSPAHRAKISSALKGKPKSSEHIAASRLSISLLEKRQCPHCDFYGRNNDRWHFNNCRHKPIK